MTPHEQAVKFESALKQLIEGTITRIEIVFDYPAHEHAEYVEAAVVQYVDSLDDYHRALGGNGLRVGEPWEAESDPLPHRIRLVLYPR